MVKRLHCYHRDVGSNPTTTRNENQTLGTSLQKVAQGSEQDLSGRPAMLKLNYTSRKPNQKKKQKKKHGSFLQYGSIV